MGTRIEMKSWRPHKKSDTNRMTQTKKKEKKNRQVTLECACVFVQRMPNRPHLDLRNEKITITDASPRLPPFIE